MFVDKCLNYNNGPGANVIIMYHWGKILIFENEMESFFIIFSRYADIIVHRLLAVAVGADSTYPDLTDKHKQAEICKNINYRHKMAQYSQRASVAFHTQVCIYLL